MKKKQEIEFEVVHATNQHGIGRYLIVDLSGKVLDDAQGFGFKSKEKAQRCGQYRFGSSKKVEWMISKPVF
jgi:hypothetical protein